MLEITSLKNGLVIDHIEAGAGVKIFKYLNLDKNNERAALIINAESKQYGRKDIIKFEKEQIICYNQKQTNMWYKMDKNVHLRNVPKRRKIYAKIFCKTRTNKRK